MLSLFAATAAAVISAPGAMADSWPAAAAEAAASLHHRQTQGQGGGDGKKQQQSGAGAGAAKAAAAMENILLSNYLYYTLACVAAVFITWRVIDAMTKFVRHVTCLNNDTQRYFASPSTKLSWLKKNVIYAPLLSKRHNREFQLSSVINVGTVPSRLQFVFLLAYFTTNIAFCVIDIPFNNEEANPLKQLRNRSGILSVVNMIPLFLMAGRNNPLINLLGISFDTFNLLHRWFGRIVIIEAVVHTLAYFVGNASEDGWAATIKSTTSVPFLLFGFIATIAFVVIGIQAASPIRHAFYETFKVAHILLAILSIIGVWYHLDLKKLPQLQYMYAVIILWGFDRLARVLRVVYYQLGSGGTRTLIEALPDNACRVTVTMARPWTFRPGQHAYLYMPGISFWQSHPFTVAWSREADHPDNDRLPMDRRDVLGMKKTSMSFIIRARTGFTNSLFEKASEYKEGKMVTTCFVEGPYGGLHDMSSYGTVMLFAGGVGITQAVPHVRDLVAGYGNGTVAARKIVLVWIIQTPEHLEWIRPWMTEVLAMGGRREVLRIMLFVSRPRSTKEIHSPSATVQMFPGRPNIDTLLGIEMENQVGALGVSVCGPGSLSDDVRRAVRNRQYQGSIDFVEEAFSW